MRPATRRKMPRGKGAETEALAIGAGGPVDLPNGRMAWRAAGGGAEVYLQTTGFRVLLAAVEPGGMVFSLDPAPEDEQAATLCVTGPAGAHLQPLAEPEATADGNADAAWIAGAETWLVQICGGLNPGARPDPEVGPGILALDATRKPGTAPENAALLSVQGPLWLLLEAGERIWLCGREPALEGPLAVPISESLWAQAPADQRIETADCARLLREGQLVDAVAAFNGRLPAILAALRAARDSSERDRLARAAAEGPSADGDSRSKAASAAVETLAQALGEEPGPRMRVRHGDYGELPLVLRQAGLRARKISLTGRWWRRDIGPLIAIEEKSGHAVAMLRDRQGYVAWAADPADSFVVNRQNAARIGPAYAVHARLPEAVTGFVSLARHLVPTSLRDGLWALAAGAGMGLTGVLVPMATGWVLSDIVPGRLPGLLIAVGLALIAAALFSTGFSAALGIALQRIAGRSGIQVTAALADRVLRLAPAFFRDYSPADLNERIDAVDEMRRLIITVLVSSAIAAAFSLFYLGLLLFYDLRLALLSLSLVAIYVGAVVIARLSQRRHLRDAAKRQGRTAGATYETLSGIAKLRVAGAEERALARWSALYRKELGAYARVERIAAHFDAFSESFQTVTLLMLFGAAALLADAGLPPGLFIGFLVAFGAFQGAFTAFCESLLSVLAAAPMAERAAPLLSTAGEPTSGRAAPGPLSGAIEISGLSFAYGAGPAGDGGRKVLDDLCLTVAPGQHVAIVGASGSGKSTLFRLLLGFEVQARGSITYDGQDLSRLDLAALRRQIGVVMQSSRLFAGTIQENIRGASDAGLGACLEAAERAGLGPDLETLPMGLQTPIVEGAGTLSGGQKQRILIARALVSRPSILFLDEATSALDNLTQDRVTHALDDLGVTRLVIAHRLSTVRNADRICVLSQGKVVETGNYDALMDLDGIFADLARRQLTGD